MSEDFHRKYRPAELDEVIGQDAIVKSLQKLFKGDLPHAFLFTGGSGTGKTTLARIVAGQLGCDSNSILEVDAATHTGIDAWRGISSQLQYASFGDSPTKFVIVDECHQLSKSSWNSLLKIIEEPPSHLFFAFCTTEFNKVPKTIQTRCHKYTLKDVRSDDLIDLLNFVCEEEELEMPKGAVQLIARESGGSPREALVYLSQSRGCDTKDEVAEILRTPGDSPQVIDFCRFLIKSPKWKEAQRYLKEFKELNPESVRIQVVNYVGACILGAKSEKDVFRLLPILEAFSTEFYQATGNSDLLLATCEVIFGE